MKKITKFGLVVVGILIIVGVVGYTMVPGFLADLAAKPGMAPLFDSPSNYDLPYEDVTFKASDGVSLSGWLINPGKDKVVIQTHFGLRIFSHKQNERSFYGSTDQISLCYSATGKVESGLNFLHTNKTNVHSINQIIKKMRRIIL